MQYVFANYAIGKRTLRIGDDLLVVNDGVADIDELNPAQVALAEVYGGKPVATTKQTKHLAVNQHGSARIPMRGEHGDALSTIYG